MNYALDYGSGSFCWLCLTDDCSLLFKEFCCVFPRKSLYICRCILCWADHEAQTLGSPVRSNGLSKTTGSMWRGNCIVSLVTFQGKDELISPCFFSSDVFAPLCSSLLTHLCTLLIKKKAEVTINYLRCWGNIWLIFLEVFSPMYQCFSFFCSFFIQFDEDCSGLLFWC